MVSSTDDYKYIKSYIEANENNENQISTSPSISDDDFSLDLEISDSDSFKYDSWFKNLKSYENGIIITRLVVFIIISVVLVLACVLECKKKLPVNGIFYALFIAFYIFQIVFHILFAILSIVLGTAELLSIAQYALLLPSGAKISGPILKRGATQIAFSLFFFVYQLVFMCLIPRVFGMFRRKELVGQESDGK
jgi:hypothetical protein